MVDFTTYYDQYFQTDLINFKRQIPTENNKHYNELEFYIQYFYLTPNFKYLDIINKENQGLFAVTLYWLVLIDQVFFSNFRSNYNSFQKKTLYPKLIGNCTAPSLMVSECGHHLHPYRVLVAINDTSDKGNKFELDRDIFKKDESLNLRKRISFKNELNQSKEIIKTKQKEYFNNCHPNIDWANFWKICELEFNKYNH